MIRKVGLLLLILAFGAAVETAWTLREKVDLGPFGWRVLAGRFYGPSYTFEAEETHPASPGTAVEVHNAFGAVRVSRGEPGQVKVKLRKVVFRRTEEEARAFADRIRLAVEPAGTTLRLGTNREELDRQRANQRVGFETHLDVALPPDTALTVRSEHGAVDVADVGAADVWGSFEAVRLERVAGPAVVRGRHGPVRVVGVRGPLSLSARHGDVEVLDVTGASELEVEHGSVVASRVGGLKLQVSHGGLRADNVAGDLDVTGRHAGIEVRDVTGNAVAATTHADISLQRAGGEARLGAEHGAVRASDVKGRLVASATFNDVELSRVSGPVEVTVQHGGLRGEDLEAGARVRAAGNDVLLEGFRGALEIQVERGGAKLYPRGPVVAPLNVATSHGGIALSVPPGSSFDLEAAARNGEVSIDVDGLTVTRSERAHLSGRLGSGGSLVRLVADHGDVRVEAAPSVKAGP